MVKDFTCTHCNALLRVQGQAQGGREVSQSATCPDCKTTNDVMWPTFGGGFNVTVVRRGNNPESEDIVL
jgi:phage FluMu protein Com